MTKDRLSDGRSCYLIGPSTKKPRSLSPTALVSIHFFFFFKDPPPTEIYPLSLHAALPIFRQVIQNPEGTLREPLTAAYEERAGTLVNSGQFSGLSVAEGKERIADFIEACGMGARTVKDRKSTRLNSSHSQISYAVFCLKKK